MQLLKETLLDFNFCKPEVIHEIAELFTPVYFKKSLIISREQSIPVLYFIERGLVRAFFEYEKEEHTCWVINQGFILPSIEANKSYLCHEYYQFLEDTSAWSLKLNNAEFQGFKNPDLHRLLAHIQLVQLKESWGREILLRIPSAEKRLRIYKEMHGKILYKITNDMLASMLRVNPKYLYKLKKRLR